MTIPGSHLDKLYHLRNRINDEIRMEEQRRGITHQPVKPARNRRPARAAAAPQPPVEQRMRDAGVKPSDVRAWALKAGLPVAGRGRISADLFDAYLEAHQENR